MATEMFKHNTWKLQYALVQYIAKENQIDK